VVVGSAETEQLKSKAKKLLQEREASAKQEEQVALYHHKLAALKQELAKQQALLEQGNLRTCLHHPLKL
jgi:hypothetical protein